MGIRIRRWCPGCHRSCAIIYEGPSDGYREEDYADGLCIRCRELGREPHPGTICDLIWCVAFVVIPAELIYSEFQ